MSEHNAAGEGVSSCRDYSINLSGLNIAIREWGQASQPPLITLHGWLDNAGSFAFLAPLLSQYRVIAIDLPGHGWSDHRPSGGGYDIWRYVADVVAIADALELSSFSLLGHSMGAIVSMLTAGTLPERVTSLILIEGLVPFQTAAEEMPKQLARAITWDKYRENSHFPDLEMALKARMRGGTKVSYDAAKALAERGIETRSDDSLSWRADPMLRAPSMVRLTEEQCRAFLQRLSMPTLLIIAESGILPAPLVNYWCDDYPQIKRVWLPGGHHLHLESSSTQIAVEVNGFGQN